MLKSTWGTGERNEGNADNKGGNARNEMSMQVQRISVGIRGIWVKIQKYGESGWRCTESKWKPKYSGRNNME